MLSFSPSECVWAVLGFVVLMIVLNRILFKPVYANMEKRKQKVAAQLAAGSKFALLTDAVHRLSCVEYVQQADEARKEALRTVAWYVDCGDDDFLLDCNLDFIKALRAARIPYSLRVRDGGHTWEYWHSALYNALPFFSRTFTANDRKAE